MELELDQARIEERGRILHEVDAQECTGCGCPAPPEVATDPAWFIDSEGHRDEAGDPYEVAIIRCPGCWLEREEEAEADDWTPGQTRACPGHEWAYTGTQYGGDDERWGGEGRCYCIHCGADGDA